MRQNGEKLVFQRELEPQKIISLAKSVDKLPYFPTSGTALKIDELKKKEEDALEVKSDRELRNPQRAVSAYEAIVLWLGGRSRQHVERRTSRNKAEPK